jgi:RNA polymerase primary sigma factor
MAKLSFKPKQVTKHLLDALRDRSLDVVASRFGLKTDSQRKTLEAIGQKYGITRERVRQIENSALNSIRKSEEYKNELRGIYK